ncbi:PadR family transcriptional regulator [Actinotalea sp. M2MS4P-6]|uniref:PadR family transcriptional regulator n=1 Tax=Actinotalea sp. M2MS4P-6 TaxID=2983762 RepID=UPI0021E3D162|nr:PadR family transcriptional regulator [Actinotalea sp. M2MS4P-6]MCV2393860.1 PadR family transcriptional regulator [Actinotalea sp. M2MS4P-6]
MSIRHGIIALLAEQDMHGYQLKVEFERRTGGTWPVNIGQIYTTVQRLVRDGLVLPAPGERSDDRADVERFTLTDAGRAQATVWWSTPVERGAPARDELAIKLALAVTAPGVDVRDVVQAQRTESMRALHDFTRLKAAQPQTDDLGADLAWSLVLDHLVFDAEAEVRWLDHVEARVARASLHPRPSPRPTDDPAAGGAGGGRARRRSGAPPPGGRRR